MPNAYQKQPSSDSLTFFALGALVALMLLLLPFWDGYLMLMDPVLNIFIPKGMAIALIAACGALFLLYVLTSACAVYTVPSGDQQQIVMLTMLWVFLNLFGTVLTLLSFPLTTISAEMYNEALTQCGSGAYTGDLAFSYNTLAQWRAEPSCSQLESVELCRNLSDPNVTGGALQWRELKALETELRCSGFCTQLTANATYPQPLFSNSSLLGTCSGAAGREVKFLVGGFSRHIFWQGVIMVIVCILLGFLSVLTDMKHVHDHYMGTSMLKGSANPYGTSYGSVP